jgi:hypothetical protein
MLERVDPSVRAGNNPRDPDLILKTKDWPMHRYRQSMSLLQTGKDHGIL